MNKNKKRLLAIGIIFVIAAVYFKHANETKVLKQIISRLEADSRAAQVMVTDVNVDKNTGKEKTTIKFLEYDALAKPMPAKYFTFTGNIIQFQSLVVRYDDLKIRRGDKLKGKSAYLFMKAFALDGKNTEEFEITKIGTIPDGYKVDGVNKYEQKLWANFWDYILNNDQARKK